MGGYGPPRKAGPVLSLLCPNALRKFCRKNAGPCRLLLSAWDWPPLTTFTCRATPCARPSGSPPTSPIGQPLATVSSRKVQATGMHRLCHSAAARPGLAARRPVCVHGVQCSVAPAGRLSLLLWRHAPGGHSPPRSCARGAEAACGAGLRRGAVADRSGAFQVRGIGLSPTSPALRLSLHTHRQHGTLASGRAGRMRESGQENRPQPATDRLQSVARRRPGSP